MGPAIICFYGYFLCTLPRSSSLTERHERHTFNAESSLSRSSLCPSLLTVFFARSPPFPSRPALPIVKTSLQRDTPPPSSASWSCVGLADAPPCRSGPDCCPLQKNLHRLTSTPVSSRASFFSPFFPSSAYATPRQKNQTKAANQDVGRCRVTRVSIVVGGLSFCRLPVSPNSPLYPPPRSLSSFPRTTAPNNGRTILPETSPIYFPSLGCLLLFSRSRKLAPAPVCYQLIVGFHR